LLHVLPPLLLHLLRVRRRPPAPAGSLLHELPLFGCELFAVLDFAPDRFRVRSLSLRLRHLRRALGFIDRLGYAEQRKGCQKQARTKSIHRLHSPLCRIVAGGALPVKHIPPDETGRDILKQRKLDPLPWRSPNSESSVELLSVTSEIWYLEKFG